MLIGFVIVSGRLELPALVSAENTRAKLGPIWEITKVMWTP
jgi:hypothetical protein